MVERILVTMLFLAVLCLSAMAPTVTSGASSKPAGPLTCPEEMVFIPGGSFRLGATKRPVEVKPFCLDRTEVTAAEYEVCVESDHCSSQRLYDRSWATFRLHDDHPVNYVTWAQADRYCRARYKRLPTEEEWEWAARGGPAGNAYPWGNDSPSNQLCWNGEGNDLGKGKRDKTCPVTMHPKDVTPQGVLGLGGNVAEWTSTRGKRGERVVRGGDWGTKEPSYVRVDLSEPQVTDYGLPTIGFRCAAEPERPRPRG